MTPYQGEAPQHASSLISPAVAAEHFLRRLPDPCRLLVAFSGGSDSTGLLSALTAACRSYPGVALHSATVDHGLRSGSAAEAETAGETSGRLGVPHSILRWTGVKPATGLQAAAREARYSLLASEAIRIGADFIVSGHTLDDQRETMFMRGLRSPGAVAGMDAAVLLQRQVWLIRPFLGVGRAAIRAYLCDRSLGWSEDPSNDNPAFERVRIRQSLALVDGGGPPSSSEEDFIGAARFVRDSVRLHAGLVATVDLEDFRTDHRLALATLLAVMGGREHGPGAEVAAGLVARLAVPVDFRTTANRVVLDRRGRTLFLYREERGLETRTVMPGESACWDGRFEIANDGGRPVTIGAGRALEGSAPLQLPGPDDGLPGDVIRRVALSAPRVIDGDPATLRVRPVLAPFERFLPGRKLELANSLATAFQLEQFPLLRLGNGAF
ncbi:MAG: tRNA lysidine(34) synthetase TilS [Rhizobium sp.]|nr:tRNA lysidine(34) synthetase TilS [Rhizobium sp.]